MLIAYQMDARKTLTSCRKNQRGQGLPRHRAERSGWIGGRRRVKKRTRRDSRRVGSGGDGGNRTRVRKIRPTEIYERSRFERVTAGHLSGKINLQLAVRARKPSFAQSTASGAALRLCDARSHRRAELGMGGRGLAMETGCLSDRLKRRGAWQRRKCYWHLILCTDLSSSAPLGSHSGTSLLRRSLSSPGFLL